MKNSSKKKSLIKRIFLWFSKQVKKRFIKSKLFQKMHTRIETATKPNSGIYTALRRKLVSDKFLRRFSRKLDDLKNSESKPLQANWTKILSETSSDDKTTSFSQTEILSQIQTEVSQIKSEVKTKLKLGFWRKTFRDLRVGIDEKVVVLKALYHNREIPITPTFLQMEATECGSVCLAIILGYYDHELTPEEARTACGVSRDGSKASHIVRAARQYQMSAKGYSVKDINDLKAVRQPCILHWNFDHFVVFEGKLGKYYYINDPATGRRRIEHEEFNTNFTGVALELLPDVGFEPREQKSSLQEFFEMALTRGVGGILAAFAYGVVQVLPTLFIAVIGKIFIDYILIKNMSHWLPQLILLVGICVVFQCILMTLSQRLLTRLSMHFKLTLESMIVHKLFYLPLKFFDQRFSGDILYRLSSTEQLSSLLSLDIMGALSNIFGILIFTIILSSLSFSLFSIMMLFVFFRIIVFLATRNSVRESNIHYEQQSGKVAGIEMNGLNLMDTLKANNLESVFFNNWAANHDTLINKSQIVTYITQRVVIWLTTLTGLMSVALLYHGTYLVMDGEMTIGTLMAFLTLSLYLDGPIMTLLGFFGQLEKIKASINRFNDVIHYDASEALKDTGGVLPPLQDQITLNDITFAYAPLDPPILRNLNLHIPKGKTVAIVGTSGSGKSTISKLLCGLYPITSGSIIWDTQFIESVSVEDRNRHISLVDQDIFLFDGTVRENLTSWEKDVDEETLLQSLKDVGLYEELLPRGLLNSHVGENGCNLSGGQRQRLEIARALIRRTDVLILDEATSSLDVANEKHVYDSLEKRGVTTIIIAHRLSTIQKANTIYVIENGEVTQCGRHRELVKIPGLYRQLVALESAEKKPLKPSQRGRPKSKSRSTHEVRP